MSFVKAKKFLGQHFLINEQIASSIAKAVISPDSPKTIIEVGAGTGALTKYLFEEKDYQTFVIEIDFESIAWLQEHFPKQKAQVFQGDFLHADFDYLLKSFYPEGISNMSVIGNFPYNISSQILFKVLKHRDQVSLCVGMFQQEVAERIASTPRKKSYGILSVLMQTFYEVEYLFEVPPTSFNPPPKVNSAVLRFIRNDKKKLRCDEKKFFTLVKTGFNQRRKTLRNALKKILPPGFDTSNKILDKRAEELSSSDFESLAELIEKG